METRSPAAELELNLLVRDHPGTLPHICGLMMRRCFRYTRLSYRPTRPGCATVKLGLVSDQCCEQIVMQLAKLYDVLDIEVREERRPGFQKSGSENNCCEY